MVLFAAADWNSNGDRVRPRARLFLEDVDESIDTYDEMPHQRLPPMVVSAARGPTAAGPGSLMAVVVVVAILTADIL